MGDVIPIRKSTPRQRAKGRTLCSHGFHKWQTLHSKQFDVKQGRLVTVLQCERCGTRKTRAL